MWAHLHKCPLAARLGHATALLPDDRCSQEAAVQAADSIFEVVAMQLSPARSGLADMRMCRCNACLLLTRWACQLQAGISRQERAHLA